MNTENIRADIELLRKITDSWNGAVPEIERDIAITLLGRLYTEIKIQRGRRTRAAMHVPRSST
ncbi:MAG: hypothetical protein L6V35_05815 [Alistipes putredinis]|nr:MAG: hypothetical protein L6V35_05815 [Alistipes putredinis]